MGRAYGIKAASAPAPEMAIDPGAFFDELARLADPSNPGGPVRAQRACLSVIPAEAGIHFSPLTGNTKPQSREGRKER